MNKISKTDTPGAGRPDNLPGQWLLHEAKARFSELVRRARTEGPQRVTVHGRDEAVVLSAEDYRRINGERTGAALIEAMQALPCRELDFEAIRDRAPGLKVDS